MEKKLTYKMMDIFSSFVRYEMKSIYDSISVVTSEQTGFDLYKWDSVIDPLLNPLEDSIWHLETEIENKLKKYGY